MNPRWTCFRRFCRNIGFILVLWFLSINATAATQYARIGTGSVKGVYYPTGAVIARMVNTTRSEHGIRVTIQSTDGSVFNINAVVAGELEFGIAQSDRQYQAVQGLAEWTDSGSQDSLRAICSLYSETITVLAAADSGIVTIKDLFGKIVNIGEAGSGQHQNAIDVLTAVGIDYHKDITAEQQNPAIAPKLLQDGRIDAFFYTVGHPNEAVREAASGRVHTRFIPIEGPEIQNLLEEQPYYTEAVIPIALYPEVENTEDVPTFGVKATLVTSLNVPDDMVYHVTKAIFENLNTMKSLHTALSSLTQAAMLEGLSAPIHPGALKYYQEVGLHRLIPGSLK